MGERKTEHIPLIELRRIVPSYRQERERELWQRNGPSGDNLAALTPVSADVTLHYADHQDGFIDIHLPAGPPTPGRLVFLVHGGAWRDDWDRTYLSHLAHALTESGAVVALPEFRRVGGGGGFPVTTNDVLAALLTLRAALTEAAPGWVDANERIVVVGHSSGGQLGPWAAFHAGPAVVSKVVAVAPPLDLEFQVMTKHHPGTVEAFLGGTPDEVPENYRDADVVSLMTGEIAVIIVQGTEDLQLSTERARRGQRRLQGTPNVTYVELSDTDHFDPINPQSASCRNIVIPAILH